MSGAVFSDRIGRAKKAFATRRIPKSSASNLLTGTVTPRAGDLVLARIEELGQHRHIELESGRRARVFPGDEVILAFGNRYAPDQFEAFVSETLEPCHMVAAGGIAAKACVKHGMMGSATGIQPLGILADGEGRALNLKDYTLPPPDLSPEGSPEPFTVAVVGTSMNAGKTETATQLIRGLRAAGLKVGAAKITGTGSGGDLWSMIDAGASPVVDFTDAGLPSTYLMEQERIESAMKLLLGHIRSAHVDAVILEIADGLFQKETASLLQSELFRSEVDGVVFAAPDALGAVAGTTWLTSRNIPVLAISGLITQSPLAMREAKDATQAPLLLPKELAKPEITSLFGLKLGKNEPALATPA